MTRVLCALLLALLASSARAGPYPGVPTRDQNPLLQAYFIPAMPAVGADRWSFSHSLYITNTYQRDTDADEQLLIDVENTRYDFQANFRHNRWIFNLNLSLIDNRGGFLDQTIEGWHDIFGLPQGGRDMALNNRIGLRYLSNGSTLIDSQHSARGLADIQLAIGTATNSGQWWLAVELPSSANSPLISNDGVDIAAWYATASEWRQDIRWYGLAGIALPADRGLFRSQLNSHYLFGQLGLLYRHDSDWHFFFQLDVHSAIVKDSDLDAFDNSLQGQFGLRLPSLLSDYQLDLFFSEDLFPGHAPDITFSLRLSPS